MMTIKAGLPRATPKGTERSDDNRMKVSVKHRIWIGFPPAHSTQRLRKVSVYSIQFAGVNCGSKGADSQNHLPCLRRIMSNTQKLILGSNDMMTIDYDLRL